MQLWHLATGSLYKILVVDRQNTTPCLQLNRSDAGNTTAIERVPSRPCPARSAPHNSCTARTAGACRDKAGGRWVLKGLLVEHGQPERNQAVVDMDARTAAISRLVAERFMKATAAVAAGAGAPTSLSYASASVVVLDEPGAPGGQAVYLKEPWLESAWIKWTRNDGHVFPGTPRKPLVGAGLVPDRTGLTRACRLSQAAHRSSQVFGVVASLFFPDVLGPSRGQCMRTAGPLPVSSSIWWLFYAAICVFAVVLPVVLHLGAAKEMLRRRDDPTSTQQPGNYLMQPYEPASLISYAIHKQANKLPPRRTRCLQRARRTE
jgi:hypothetical protein